VELIAQYVLFLEHIENGVPLEAIVTRQEDLAERLQRLSPEDRAQFVRLLDQIAAETSSPEDRGILSRLPDDAGIR